MQLPGPRYARPAPPRTRYQAPNTPEWSLLTNVLSDLSLVEHIEPELLAGDRAESSALLAIRDFYRGSIEEPSFAVMIDSMSGQPSLEVVLRAQRYADEVGLEPEAARAEFEHALRKLDLVHRKAELDTLLRRGLATQEERMAYQDRLLAYKRLQGALPNP
jgi:hypothetical protein